MYCHHHYQDILYQVSDFWKPVSIHFVPKDNQLYVETLVILLSWNLYGIR